MDIYSPHRILNKTQHTPPFFNPYIFAEILNHNQAIFILNLQHHFPNYNRFNTLGVRTINSSFSIRPGNWLCKLQTNIMEGQNFE
uniref:Uncharacterized protein n=1 Tax=Medicago truncatula TaxID=3880 RepID=A2Q291_MEDTR|nr:hypothetical protein MtrDRAFT_AC149576g23v2 [Medicago truncatula]